MALITCPECGKQVSSMSKTCPNCGYPIASETNDVIRIKIDNDPSCPGYSVRIFNAYTKQLITEVRSGSVAEIKSDVDLTIYFTGVSGSPMLTTTVSPKNGGKYRASWGPGFFTSRIVSCSRVDVIDS